jgi:hypothetical protein
MTQPTEVKTRNLLVMLELLAVTVAGILILIDYKLKRDLVELFARIESAIETGNKLYDTFAANNSSDTNLRDGTVVGDNPPMETPDVRKPGNTGSTNRGTAGKQSASNGSGGTRNTPVQGPGKSMGS